jgi:hypothetical protein
VLGVHQQETGQPIQAEDVKAAVVRVAKFLNLEKGAAQKPKPVAFQRPADHQAPEPKAKKQNGQARPFMTHHDRSVNNLLKGMT